MLTTRDNNVAVAFFAASLISVACSIYVWVASSADPAHAERFGIFVGLWAPTLMGLANYYREQNMTGNLYEFLGMASFVSTATFFVVGLRWFIFKLGSSEKVSEETSGYIQNK